MKLTVQMFFLSFLLTAVVPSHSYAQWSTDPYNNLIVGYGLLPEIASDSAGGCYITYEQNLGYPRRLILERLNRYGYKPWGSGKRILGEYPEQSFAKITEDGLGGVIVSYLDVDSDNWPYIKTRLRVQRVDSSGNFLWGATGVRVSLSETNQGNQAIVSDGQGGCMVAWKDTMDVIRVQKLDVFGTRAWGDSGIMIVQSTQYTPKIVRVEPDKFVIAYGASLKKIDFNGNILWGGNVVNVGFGTRSIISDNSGGVIVYDGTGTSSNILIVTQKIDSSGVFVWNSPYIVLDDSSIFNVQGNPVRVNIDGGATFAWTKTVNNRIRSFTQRVSSDGSFVFPDGGIDISGNDSTSNGTWSIVSSHEDSKIYINADSRNNGSLFGQRVDSNGVPLWNVEDNVISWRQLGYIKVISDGNNGAIIVGFDQSDFSIRVQQVSVNGILGEVITSIRDSSWGNISPNILLHQNYPNPFNSSTIIRYHIPIRTKVLIEVYDIVGQTVCTLVDQVIEAGNHQVTFYANNLPSGIYYYKLSTNIKTKTNKLIILK